MGIDKQHHTWIYRPLPMSIVRYERNRGRTAHPQCTYLGLRHIYGHIRHSQYHSSALEIGCTHSILSVYEKSDLCETKIREKKALLDRKNLPYSDSTMIDLKIDCETFRSKQPVSEINFFPYLLKVFVNTSQTSHLELCLTVNDTTLNLSLEPCIRSFESFYLL